MNDYLHGANNNISIKVLNGQNNKLHSLSAYSFFNRQLNGYFYTVFMKRIYLYYRGVLHYP